jgi:hypothetical protein
MQALSTFLQKLKAQPEGTTNVLHNTVVFASTDVADGFTHSGRNVPIVIAGKAGGLLKGDVHVKMSGASSFVAGATVCRAAGILQPIFNASPVAALLA